MRSYYKVIQFNLLVDQFFYMIKVVEVERSLRGA